MGSRTVRLDDESERILAAIQRETGLSVSAALKRGLVAVREALQAEMPATAWEVYQTLDLGPGGYAAAPARDAKRAVAEVLRRKRRR